ncbi:hypothetical protein [Bacillus sp. FJAT-29814]|uniref:hypothetical protein n=1 Tax=Bacillus sp. FJAT-29814 TaxID=1729688 RepID=UPI0008310223|nr:hypothetical protein [Bacillus sp. FJAT-29814]
MGLNKKSEKMTNEGSNYEGRDKAYVDIDRMINEGLSGGSVHARHDAVNIEHARQLPEEEPPYQAD